MLPYFCSVIDHRGRPNVVRTTATFWLLLHFEVICDLLSNRDAHITWNLFIDGIV